MSFVVLPPEINSLRMFIGAGTAPMLTAAAAWQGLAEELGIAAQSFASVTAGLAGQAWQGPAARAMAAAAAPYAGWLAAAAAQSAGAAGQARAVASMFEAAQAATVLPAAVAANRDAFVQLVMTNLFGQNAPLIAAAEGVYEEMWAADVAAMSGYYSGASAVAAQVVPWGSVLQRFPGLGGGAVGENVGSSDTSVGSGSGGGASVGSGSGGGESVGSGSAAVGGGGADHVGSGIAGGGVAQGDPAYATGGQTNIGGGEVGTGDAVGASASSANAGVVGSGFMAAPIALAALGQAARAGTNSAGRNATGPARAPEPAAAAPPAAEPAAAAPPEAEPTVPEMGALSTVDPEIAAKAAAVSATRVTQSTGSGIPESTLRTAQGQQASETAAEEEETAPSLRPEAATGQLRPRVKQDPRIQMRGG
ncbi:PPE family protein [Mycobacterium decipiens]|uniref:PPE domain-containing protein n=1 Tax=Mycobacterium decipiens TaxID=1430326 RepID=A0A1X2M0N7_9MYCO|nr:PPE family protein [Mycobacterium decipiens]OSC43197.1 hypothetical protein B8W66_02115 [Mycobacterium decipiens]